MKELDSYCKTLQQRYELNLHALYLMHIDQYIQFQVRMFAISVLFR